MSIAGKIRTSIFAISMILLFSSCSRTIGHGVLLWSTDEPSIPSGTVLAVHIRSRIDNVWVVGIPKEYRTAGRGNDKLEIPLPKLELVGSKRKARVRAEEFAPYALIYAETLQDGLPIRATPDNTARRVYRLRQGETVKVLAPARGGIPAIGTTGDPLEGEWFRVLTEDGIVGYCFSYRLRVFEHREGPLVTLGHEQLSPDDPILERILSRTWSPEHYGTMVNRRRIDMEELSRAWHFDPGAETGVASIRLSDLEIDFPYTTIRSTGTQSWRFEGSSLQMSLRLENTLAVQYTESNGLLRTLIFVSLPQRVDEIIFHETARREGLLRNIYYHGPIFTSTNYGTFTLESNGRFTWSDNLILIPQIIPASTIGSGTLDMRLFVSGTPAEQYLGAFTMFFDNVGGTQTPVDFLYSFDAQGLRIEYAPQTSLDGVTVVRRASSPIVIYFFRSGRPEYSGLTDNFLFDDDQLFGDLFFDDLFGDDLLFDSLLDDFD